MDTRAEKGAQVACAVCAMNTLCHSRAVAHGAPPPVQYRRRIPAGERVFAAGEPRAAVVAVHAGFLKVLSPDPTGGGHIVRFLLPGDAAGLDARGESLHASDAIALEDSEVCEIPTYRLELMAEHDARIGALVRELLSGELAEAQAHSATLSRLTAAQRVARLLLELSRRWAERGFSSVRFRLPMGRRDLGEHLGLTMETASRVLSDFRARGWIALPRGGIEILQPAALAALLEPQRG